jgi:hypothetical protein
MGKGCAEPTYQHQYFSWHRIDLKMVELENAAIGKAVLR